MLVLCYDNIMLKCPHSFKHGLFTIKIPEQIIIELEQKGFWFKSYRCGQELWFQTPWLIVKLAEGPYFRVNWIYCRLRVPSARFVGRY